MRILWSSGRRPLGCWAVALGSVPTHRRVQGTARHSRPDERHYPMLITTTHKIRAVLAVAAATIVATVGLGYGQAHAAPGCTASGLSSALGQDASSTGAWLSAHPEAEAAVNTADENTIRSYFAAHQADSAHQALDHMLVSVRKRAWPNVPAVTVAAAEVKPRRPRR